jgi:hypothetical protein
MKPGELVKCRACPAVMRAALMPSGKMNPLDLEGVPLADVEAGAKGVFAYYPPNGHGLSLTKARVEEGKPAKYAAAGCTFHVSHFATCPERAKFRKAGS